MTLLSPCASPARLPAQAVVLNDVHSRLNPTRIGSLLQPHDIDAAQSMVRAAARAGAPLVAMGARHSMGGQQFLRDGAVTDTGRLDRVVAFCPDVGRVTVEAGIRWPALIAWLAHHPSNTRGWTIRQKQTGGDDFSLGGAFASNIHGRGLAFAPFVDDVESIDLLDADGELRHASRAHEPELFAHAAGGYGLFGLIVQITLRLVPRTTLEREVRLVRRADLISRFHDAIARGCTYGDFQFAIDASRADFLDLGVLSCYRPVAGTAPDPEPIALRRSDFARLLALAHRDPGAAFERYAQHYLATHGQRYDSDAQQAGVDLHGYHALVDAELGHCGSEMISELYVPRARLADFLEAAAEALRRERAQAIYGTVRLIERDDASHLAWAREPWACVVFNLHLRHDVVSLSRARHAFRALIDVALERGGSFYLTYHRWATREQLDAAYPQFAEFLRAKREFDPSQRFQSDWYRAMRALYGGSRD
jgi:FAD/FMN-containing dehydrogenase